MRNFQDTFETLKRSFISTFSICMTVPLKVLLPVFTIPEMESEKKKKQLSFWITFATS